MPEGKEKKALHNPGPRGRPWESTKRSPPYLDRALRAGGYSTKDIARTLGVSERTIRRFFAAEEVA